MNEIPESQWDVNVRAYVNQIKANWGGKCAAAGLALDFGKLPVDHSEPIP